MGKHLAKVRLIWPRFILLCKVLLLGVLGDVRALLVERLKKEA